MFSNGERRYVRDGMTVRGVVPMPGNENATLSRIRLRLEQTARDLDDFQRNESLMQRFAHEYSQIERVILRQKDPARPRELSNAERALEEAISSGPPIVVDE